MQNNRNSPHNVQSPDCQVLTQKRTLQIFSLLTFGELESGGFFHWGVGIIGGGNPSTRRKPST